MYYTSATGNISSDSTHEGRDPKRFVVERAGLCPRSIREI